MSCLEGTRHGNRDAIPLRGFLRELPTSGAGQRVVLGPAVVLGGLPVGLEPTGLLETVERREQRTGLNAERTGSHLLDTSRHTKAVQLAGAECLEDQQIEGALQQGGSRVRQGQLLSKVDTSIGLTPIECQYEERRASATIITPC